MPHGKQVGVFIDGLNVRNRLRECRWTELFDVAYLAEQLAGPRHLIRTRYYTPAPHHEHLSLRQYSVERAYLERVKHSGVDVVLGYMARREKTIAGHVLRYWEEKQVDVLLATDLVYDAATRSVDVAVVASADADLVPAIKRARELGLKVELLRFRGAAPRLYALQEAADTLRRARPAYFREYLDFSGLPVESTSSDAREDAFGKGNA